MEFLQWFTFKRFHWCLGRLHIFAGRIWKRISSHRLCQIGHVFKCSEHLPTLSIQSKTIQLLLFGSFWLRPLPTKRPAVVSTPCCPTLLQPTGQAANVSFLKGDQYITFLQEKEDHRKSTKNQSQWKAPTTNVGCFVAMFGCRDNRFLTSTTPPFSPLGRPSSRLTGEVGISLRFLSGQQFCSLRFAVVLRV